MKKILSVFVLLLTLGSIAHAHSGRTNADGCHAGSKPYHCHQTPAAPAPAIRTPAPVVPAPAVNTPLVAQSTQQVEVIRVIDGDTIVVSLNGVEERVRLIGIDTPETVHPTRGVEPFGPEASEFTKTQLEGKVVGLEFDVSQRDYYGRLLAYVWLNGTELFNNTLLYYGLAQVTTFPPNVKYVDMFTATQTEARERGVGIWSQQEAETEVAAPSCVNINTASVSELDRIIHIGSARAAQIVQLRPFTSVDQLTRVNGIAAGRLSDIKAQGLACVQ